VSHKDPCPTPSTQGWEFKELGYLLPELLSKSRHPIPHSGTGLNPISDEGINKQKRPKPN